MICDICGLETYWDFGNVCRKCYKKQIFKASEGDIDVSRAMHAVFDIGDRAHERLKDSIIDDILNCDHTQDGCDEIINKIKKLA